MTKNSEIITDPSLHRGPIAWMVHNRVTPNLIMWAFLLGGLYMMTQIRKEVFPEFDLGMVSIMVPYPGASPEEVEQGILLSVEEAVRGIEGVKEVTATASEGVGTVRVELLADADQQKVYQDIKQEVDRITTFPEEAEEPQVVLRMRRHGVLTVQLYGAASEWALRNLAEEVRDRLLQQPGLTQVELVGARSFEVRIEVPQDNLRAYGLTLNQIADKISATAVEIPGGSIKTAGGEILMRFKERRDWASEFARVPVVTTAAGSVLLLGDIARVTDDFEDTDNLATYNGHCAIGLDVYRVGDQSPIGVSDAARAALAEIAPDLPPGVSYAIDRDRSEMYRQRQELLIKNGWQGLLLVLVLMGLFLEFKLAFWVNMLIPTSFLGTILFLPSLDVTINMMSMFAFIIALGMVVDNAIVIGENIYSYRQKGMDPFTAAVVGTRELTTPIGFSTLTNIASFIPLYFIPGDIGKVWKVIPVIVIISSLISWMQSVLILPAHLAHTQSKPHSVLTARLHGWQQSLGRRVDWFIEGVFRPFLDGCIQWRYLVVSIMAAVFCIVVALVQSGRIGMILMPRVEADRAIVTAVVPYGSPVSRAIAVRDQLVAAAESVGAANGGDKLVTAISAVINGSSIEVSMELTAADVRPLPTTVVTRLWRDRVGELAGLESLKFEADRGGPGSGAALTVELSHREIAVLDQASRSLAQRLSEFPNVEDIDDGYTPGKQQLDFQLKPEGRSLGLTSQAVARQVRHAFYGSEALRQQRGRNEIKVMVRLPEAERISEYNIEQLLIRTPAGRYVPLRQVAEVKRGRAYTSIDRRDGRRTVSVTADVEPIDQTGQVLTALNTTILPKLGRDYPGLTYGYEGRQADMRESMRSLMGGLLFALLGVYFLLALPFRSYTQPLIIMVSIPCGLVGAVLGHVVMGYSLSIMSIMGIVALSGVVVNTSLVLIDYANQRRAEGEDPQTAIRDAGVRRFRPIVLTTLTTFIGLVPMIFETSRQARFLIPMALSLGYGILFSTFISLVIVPGLYMILEDVKGFFRSAKISVDQQ